MLRRHSDFEIHSLIYFLLQMIETNEMSEEKIKMKKTMEGIVFYQNLCLSEYKWKFYR